MIRSQARDPASIQVEVDYAATANVALPNPTLSSSDGLLHIDGTVVTNGQTVLLPLESSEINNGPYLYTLATNTLSRYTLLPGREIDESTYVSVRSGATQAGKVFRVAGPPAIVGTNETTWTEVEQEPTRAGYFYAGPAPGNSSPKPSSARPLSMYDMPLFSLTQERNVFPQPMVNRNNVGRVSEFKDPNSVWAQRARILWMATRFNAIEFDEDVHWDGQYTGLLSNKRFIFRGNGLGGRCRQLMKANASLFDVSGSVNFRTEGDLTIEYVLPGGSTNKAIKATSSFGGLQIESVRTKGTGIAVSFGTAHLGFDIGQIGVSDPLTETAFESTNASGSAYSRLGRIIGLARFKTIATDAAVTIKAFVDSPSILHTGTLTADRTVTLSTNNVVEGVEFEIVRTGTGAFNLSIGGLKNLTTSTWCRVRYDAVGAAWKLVAYGAL